MTSILGAAKKILHTATSSEWASWGKYKSVIDGELHKTNFPSFKYEALNRDAIREKKWRIFKDGEVRKEVSESAQKFGKWWWKLPARYRIGSAIGLGLVSAFGLKVSTALIHGGSRLIYGKRATHYVENTYNEIESLQHRSKETTQQRQLLTDFGSGWKFGRSMKWISTILKTGKLGRLFSNAEKFSHVEFEKSFALRLAKAKEVQGARRHSKKLSAHFAGGHLSMKLQAKYIATKAGLANTAIEIRQQGKGLRGFTYKDSFPGSVEEIYSGLQERGSDIRSSIARAIKQNRKKTRNTQTVLQANSGLRMSMQQERAAAKQKVEAQRIWKVMGHKPKNAALDAHYKKTKRNIVDDHKNKDLFNI